MSATDAEQEREREVQREREGDRRSGSGRGSGCVKIGQKSELFCGSPLDYVTAANAAAATTTRFAPQQTLLHYLCCLKTVVCVRVCVCVSVSRRVAKSIDVLRVTSCGPLSRRLMQPQRSATQGATATKTAPIYHFPGTGTVNTGRRVQRQRRLLDSATLFLSLSSSPSLPLLTTNGFLNSRRV